MTCSLFVAHLFRKGYVAASVSTFLSAVAYLHKLAGKDDPTCSFLVKEAMTGFRRLKPSVNHKAPITIGLLEQLILAIPMLKLGQYTTLSFQAMFSLCFFALLRISEVVTTPKAQNHVIKLRGLSFDHDSNFFSLTFFSFKHSQDSRTIKICPQSWHICPVRLLNQYLTVRPKSVSEEVFLDVCGSPFSKHTFVRVLQSALLFTATDKNLKFTTHSFRIGGATHAASCGLSDSQLRHLGRWSSNAFLQYIKL